MLRNRRWSAWLVILLLAAITATAGAQADITADITPPDTSAFPRIGFYLDVHNENGNFIHGIQAGEFRLLENGRPVELESFTELRQGVQVVVALNPGASFGIRNSQGVSRFETLVTALQAWAVGRMGSTIDDLNLVITGGSERTHFTSLADFTGVLESYAFDERTAVPSLDTLARAVEIASDSAPRSGMERAVLFITAPMQGDISSGLQNLVPLAEQQRVHLFIWYVAPPESLELTEARQFAAVAEQTGGEFFAFTGGETLPNLEAYLEDLRDIYQVAYTSQIVQGGNQQLAAEISQDGITIPVAPITFSLALAPPDPAFLFPSLEIVRRLPQAMRENIWAEPDLAALEPRQSELQILIDFPDGRARDLLHTSLYVDGAIAVERTEPPFDRFTWDLSGYTTTGQHLLRVEALDTLGLKGASIEFPVIVTVELPQGNPFRALAQRWPALAGIGAVLLAAVAVLALILSGRLAPGLRRIPLRLPVRRAVRSVSEPRTDLEAAPKGESGARHLPGWVNRFQWPQRRLNPRAYAYLARLAEDGEGARMSPISILVEEITLGADPNQASLLLEDASVDALHARLIRTPEGDFRLQDEGSVAGTWVNYVEVGREGVCLENGDLIHFGRVGFRFTQRDPKRARKAVITLQEPES